jgi:hypothetical protein
LFYLSLLFKKKTNQAKDVEISILTNGVYTNNVVPIKNQLMDWNKKIESIGPSDSTYKYLAIGGYSFLLRHTNMSRT